MLDLGEVEELEKVISAGTNLSSILTWKNRSTPHNRMLSMHNFLIFERPDVVPAGMTRTRRDGSEVAQRIMTLARTWEAPADKQT